MMTRRVRRARNSTGFSSSGMVVGGFRAAVDGSCDTITFGGARLALFLRKWKMRVKGVGDRTVCKVVSK